MKKIATVLMACLILGACASNKINQSGENILLYTIPAEFSKMDSGIRILNPDKSWVNPGESVFIGVSRYAYNEQSARSDAMEKARDAYVKYISEQVYGKATKLLAELNMEKDPINQARVSAEIVNRVFAGTSAGLKDLEWFFAIYADRVTNEEKWVARVKTKIDPEVARTAVEVVKSSLVEDLVKKKANESEKEAIRKIDEAIKKIKEIKPDFLELQQ